MVDKIKQTKTTPTKDVKDVKKDKESKTDCFIRVATPRVKSVLSRLRILGNCSNRHNYDYSIEQIESMYEKIQESLDTMIAKFTPSKKEQESFNF